MTTTVLKITKGRPCTQDVMSSLQKAGVSIVEVDDWTKAARALAECETALVICDGELLEIDAQMLTEAVTAFANRRRTPAATVPPDLARSLSHDLRTPLSAMAGWVHLMESGSLDSAGLKRAIAKLRTNIEDQVRAIDRHLGASSNAGS